MDKKAKDAITKFVLVILGLIVFGIGFDLYVNSINQFDSERFKACDYYDNRGSLVYQAHGNTCATVVENTISSSSEYYHFSDTVVDGESKIIYTTLITKEINDIGVVVLIEEEVETATYINDILTDTKYTKYKEELLNGINLIVLRQSKYVKTTKDGEYSLIEEEKYTIDLTFNDFSLISNMAEGYYYYEMRYTDLINSPESNEIVLTGDIDYIYLSVSKINKPSFLESGISIEYKQTNNKDQSYYHRYVILDVRKTIHRIEINKNTCNIIRHDVGDNNLLYSVSGAIDKSVCPTALDDLDYYTVEKSGHKYTKYNYEFYQFQLENLLQVYKNNLTENSEFNDFDNFEHYDYFDAITDLTYYDDKLIFPFNALFDNIKIFDDNGELR